MESINIIYVLGLIVLLGTACSEDSTLTFDEIEDLNIEFPEALFEVSFGFAPLINGEEVDTIKNVIAPTPLDPYSFSSFDAISDVKNKNGIRYVESTLLQGLHGDILPGVPGEAEWKDKSEFIIKLNVATSGDAINGEPYEKSILLDFLEEGKTYPTEEWQLGAISLMYRKDNLFSGENEGRRVFVGIDQHDNIGESNYGVTLISVEDHEDRTRDGELIKMALKVTIGFEGVIGVSSHKDLPANLMVDQWAFQNGRASFIIDYLQ